MAQYRPCYEAHRHAELSRPILSREHQNALLIARHHKLYNLD
jgi:uncharacterized Fe-S radical SAM superfamily protein PflX